MPLLRIFFFFQCAILDATSLQLYSASEIIRLLKCFKAPGPRRSSGNDSSQFSRKHNSVDRHLVPTIRSFERTREAHSSGPSKSGIRPCPSHAQRRRLGLRWAGRAQPSAESGPAGPVLLSVYSFEHGLSGALHKHYINLGSFEIHHFQRDTRHWRFSFQDFKCQASKMHCGDTASGRRCF